MRHNSKEALPAIGAKVRATCGCHRNAGGVVVAHATSGRAIEARMPDFVGTIILNMGQFEAVPA